MLGILNFAVVRRTTIEEIPAYRENPTSIALTDCRDREVFDKISELDSLVRETRLELLRHQIACKWNLIDSVERMHAPSSHEIECPLCGHSGDPDRFGKYESHCMFGGGVLTRLQCPACDVIFGPAKMFTLTEAELSQEYEWHYRAYSEGDSTESELRAFYALTPKKDGIYLNYGAGAWSRSVKVLREQGWNVLAFEPHSSAAAGEDYVVRDRKQLAAMKFDGVFSNNVLEHLRFPVEELIYMASLLKPGAVMAHATACFEYLYEYTRFHLFFFLGKSVDLLAKRADLKIEEFIRDGDFMCIRMSKQML